MTQHTLRLSRDELIKARAADMYELAADEAEGRNDFASAELLRDLAAQKRAELAR